jgi:Na+/melibiose symporter-like transporter
MWPVGAWPVQVIQILTAPVVLLVNAATLTLSAIFVLRIRRPEPPLAADREAGLRRQIAEGLRFVLGNRLLRALAASAAVASLSGSAYAATLVVLLARDLALPEAVIGLVFSVSGAGAVIGALTSRQLVAQVGHGRILWMSIACTAPFGLLMPAIEAGRLLWPAAGGLLVVAVGATVFDVGQVSLRQALTPDRLLGRMDATMRFLVWGTMPVGGFAGGVLVQLLGNRPALWIAGTGLTLDPRVAVRQGAFLVEIRS